MRPILTLQQVAFTTSTALKLPASDWLICYLHQKSRNRTFLPSKATGECISHWVHGSVDAAMSFTCICMENIWVLAYVWQVGVQLHWISSGMPRGRRRKDERHRSRQAARLNVTQSVWTTGKIIVWWKLISIPKLTNKHARIRYQHPVTPNWTQKMCFLSSQHLPASLAALSAVGNSAQKRCDTSS